ncbi:STAS domain-containing protein [Ramlibacter tataouinensis]|uniref:STAS domain-containing protein n=1 Tax=Ramlibacter tataouinensis TaxID=94132 RepID=UPI0022F3C787|nr:STAS domain-containing protein [Ramlibacter tataouinensis]WBY00224.1 STAS domain-containing protein [Ramlibacter tataouinensis]
MTAGALHPAGRDADDPLRLAWQGPATIYEAPELRRQLLAALQSGRDFELDLRAVEEIDTAGIQLLAAAQREALDAGRRCALVAASPAVRQALALYRLDALQPTTTDGSA